MASLKESLSQSSLQNLIDASIQEGAVYRMRLGKDEGVKGKEATDDSRNKYFIVIGEDTEGNAIGFVLIDTEINKNIPQRRKDAHYLILAKDYEFLEGKDRYVDCSNLKIISHEKFSSLFNKQTIKGTMKEKDINMIKKYLRLYKNIPVALLKRFGLL